MRERQGLRGMLHVAFDRADVTGIKIFFWSNRTTPESVFGLYGKYLHKTQVSFPVKPGGKAVCRGVGLLNYLFCPPCCLKSMIIDHRKMMMIKSILSKLNDHAHAEELSILTPSGRCSTEALSGCGTCQEYRCDTITTNIIIQIQLT